LIRHLFDLLVAPHNGSKTSSGRDFIKQLMPTHVVFSAGYQHHFGYPHANAIKRYELFGSKQWVTADDGAVTFEWNNSGELKVLTAKENKARFGGDNLLLCYKNRLLGVFFSL